MSRLLALLPCLTLAFVCQASFSSVPLLGQEPVAEYSIDLSDSKNHYITVTATLEPTANQTQTELMMSVWTPGSYLVREYARNMDSLTIHDQDGNALDFKKTRKNRWLVQHGKAKRIVFRYRLYCNEMSVRTNWVGLQYAMLNGAPTFVTVVGQLQRPHHVTLNLPRNWKRSATSLKQLDEAHHYVAQNFDELVDSPIVAGNINVYPFTAGGIEHQLVNVGESGYWDGAKAAKDLQQMVEEHHRMWGNVPYDRYLFLNMISESGGGLEHDNSTLIMTSRWSFRDERRYKSWLSLASHEFFHTWNVRRLRPKSLVEYDYENEIYTRSLWIAEGITSYYQDLALVRAGLLSEKEYLERISGDVESVQRTEGRKKQSLTDSSYDTWIKFYRPDENSSNTRISYYSKGAVAAFLLDARIRKLTQGQKSLDDVMRRMFDQYADSGFTPSDFRKVASQIAGQDLTEWFQHAIDSTKELDYSDLEAIGVDIPKPAKKSSEKTEEAKTEDDQEDSTQEESGKPAESDASDEKVSKGKPYLGFSTSGDDKVTVSSVKPDSPAYEAGVNVDDELIAINDFRVRGGVDSRLKQFEVGDSLELLLARRGKLLRLKVVIGARETESWRLKYTSKPSDEQKAQKKLWLSVPKSDQTKDAE